MVINTVIVGTGSFIPERVIPNDYFMETTFYDSNRKKILKPTAEVIEDLVRISGIRERRYVAEGQTIHDLAYLAAVDALQSSGIDTDSLDGLIVAHNSNNTVPNMSSTLRNRLGITNKEMEVYDVMAACPGWVKGIVLAGRQIRDGSKRVMVIGAEIISNMVDPHDVNSMLFGDGAGAAIIEGIDGEEHAGIISYASHAGNLDAFSFGSSYNPEFNQTDSFIKMNGHAVYKYVVKYVPKIIRKSIEKAGLGIEDIKKVFVHQANQRMNDDMLKRLFWLYKREAPPDIMPMTISWLGNTSVATVPTLLDLVMKGKMEGHYLSKGDNIVIASVGAGMNIDSIVYRVH